METHKINYSVVTTFNEDGLKKYGQRMINGFLLNWPVEVQLHLYPEFCNPIIQRHENVFVKRLEEVGPLKLFKEKWKNVPKANGDVTNDPIRSKRKDAGKGFKWNAIRFAHKVYAIFDCAANTSADILIWMDADTVCHSPLSINSLQQMIPYNSELCYLGRRGKYSECGLYSLNLTSQNVQQFLKEFQKYYDDADNGIFTLDEWHDSFVFDAVRKKFPKMQQHDWAEQLHDIRPRAGMSQGEGHPLINSAWGAYLDHLKGSRKNLGRSKKEDLRIPRTEAYWR